MRGVDKGSSAAWTTRALLDAWFNDDDSELEEALSSAREELPEVIRNLIVVAGATVLAVAAAAGRPFSEVLASIWAQLAQKKSDDDASRVMRAAVTAWCNGDEDAKALNDSGAFAEVDVELLILHFLGVTRMIVEHLCKHRGEATTAALDGLWQSLGTV